MPNQELLHKLICLIDLLHVTGASNNNIACLEEADGNTFALSLSFAISLTLAKLLATTLTRLGFITSFIVIVFSIDALIDSAL